MITLKNKQDILQMQIVGRALAEVFYEIETSKIVSPGMSTKAVDAEIENLLNKKGLKGPCKGYKSGCRNTPAYPCVSCISLNSVIVHGIPSEKEVLKSGDFVKIDLVASKNGYFADMARGFFVGGVENASSKAVALNQAAIKSFEAGVSVLKHGVYLSDVSRKIQESIEGDGFFVVREFFGHGIGKSMHEDPIVPNYFGNFPSVRCMQGLCLAIEPMILEAPDMAVIDDDGWTARSQKGYLAAHYENTVLVTSSGVVILTSLT